MRKLFKERKLFKGGNYMRKYGMYQNLKSFKSHEKNETKNIRSLVFSFSPIDLAF